MIKYLLPSYEPNGANFNYQALEAIKMKSIPDISETIGAGDTASIENTGSKKLSISLICNNCCRVDLELVPGQAIELSAGNSDAKVVLHHGDPSNLFIIKPESAS